MNDRFKFRVWAKPHEPTQTEGYYVDDSDYMAMFPNGEVEIDYYVDNGYDGSVDGFEQDEIVIEQCTGLKDKNGKLIFEGDIVRWSLCRGDGDICENYQIIWRDNCAAFGCLKSNGDILNMFSQPELKAKVIGNVHENPELLESEE